MKYNADGTYSYVKGDRIALMGVVEDVHDAGNLSIALVGHPLEHLHVAAAVLADLDVLKDINHDKARKAAGVVDPEPVAENTGESAAYSAKKAADDVPF